MAFGLKRADLRAMAQAKIDDASFLLQHGRTSNAYYLAGYSIELGLKACIAAQVSAETIPDKDFIKRILNHDFMTLIGLAGLATQLKEKKDSDPIFAANWAIVSEWEPDSRYESKDTMSAQLIIGAIADPNQECCNGSKHFGSQRPRPGEGVGYCRPFATSGDVGP